MNFLLKHFDEINFDELQHKAPPIKLSYTMYNALRVNLIKYRGGYITMA